MLEIYSTFVLLATTERKDNLLLGNLAFMKLVHTRKGHPFGCFQVGCDDEDFVVLGGGTTRQQLADIHIPMYLSGTTLTTRPGHSDFVFLHWNFTVGGMGFKSLHIDPSSSIEPYS
jgi:hypothetical protein